MRLACQILIIIILLQVSAISNDWKLIEKFDNTPTTTKSDVIAINCRDSSCYALVQHLGESSEYSWRLYNSNIYGVVWDLIYIAPNTFQQTPPKVFNIRKGTSPITSHYFVASDDNSIILKSIDSGKTFKKIILESGYNEINNFAMYDTNYGFATNDNAFFTTEDGWETFDRHDKLSSNHLFFSTTFIDSNTVALSRYVTPPSEAHSHLAFMKYHLIEDKWDTLFYFGAEYKNWFDGPHNIYFVNDTLGFSCGSRSDTSLPKGNYYDIIYRTKDGGNSWEVVHKDYVYPQIGFYNNISFADEKNGIAVGFYGKIAMTNDGGDTWVYEPTPNEMDNCRKMQVCWAGRTPLIGTWDAGIFRYEGDFFKFPEDTTSVVEDLITNYQLLITPNPAGDYIDIKFKSDGCNGACPIEIYNVLGECLLTLPNTPTPKIDISCLPAGVYFVRIKNFKGIFIKS